MDVVIDGIEYIPKPELKKYKGKEEPTTGIVAFNDTEAFKLYQTFYPLCPECGCRAFPTNFPPESFGGEKNDKSIVWFCSDMGHCAFSIDEKIKWKLKSQKEK